VTFRDRLDRVWPSLVALLGTVAVVFGLLTIFGNVDTPAGGDNAAAGTGTPAPTMTSADGTASAQQTPAAPVTAPPELRSDIGILNATDVDGLAGQAKEALEDGGWSVPATDTYSGNIDVTTVYYPPGEEESARALAAQFPEIKAVEPTIEGLTSSRLVLVLAEDYAEAVGATG
jgi:LytR cell envelope-related transcriptional attenuator